MSSEGLCLDLSRPYLQEETPEVLGREWLAHRLLLKPLEAPETPSTLQSLGCSTGLRDCKLPEDRARF